MPIDISALKAKFNTYAQQPKCKGKTPDEIFAMMLKEHKISAWEYSICKAKASVFTTVNNKPTVDNNPEGYENFGLFVKHKNSKVQISRYEYKYHPLFNNQVAVDDSGNAMPEQFSLSSLKTKYPSDTYTITCKKRKNDEIEEIIVLNKKTNSLVLTTFKNYFYTTVTFFDTKNNKDYKLISFTNEQPHQIDRISTYSQKNRRYINYDPATNLPIKKEIINADNTRTVTDYERNSKKFKRVHVYSDNGKLVYEENYTNGKPWRIMKNGKYSYPLVNDIISDLNESIKSNKITDKLCEDILRINVDNENDILQEYQKRTGTHLINHPCFTNMQPKSKREAIMTHLKTVHYKTYPPENSGRAVAAEFINALESNDRNSANKIKSLVPMIDENNIKYVLNEFRQLKAMQNRRFSNKDNLLSAINDNKFLSVQDKKYITARLINLSLKGLDKKSRTRIQNDINAHRIDFYKIEIDLYRALNIPRIEQNTPKEQTDKNSSQEPYYSNNLEQGRTGDCWLIAGLKSAMCRKEIAPKLASVVTQNFEKDYVVELRGIKKKITVSQDMLDSYPHISKGSLFAKIIEIALDTHIRDCAYAGIGIPSIDEDFGTFTHVSIDGNSEAYLMKILLGVSESKETIDPKTYDFNAKRKAYCIDFHNSNPNTGIKKTYQGLATCKDDMTLADLQTRHTYSIVGSDKNNIYITNPWNTKAIITLPRKNLEKTDYHISCYDFDNPSGQ